MSTIQRIILAGMMVIIAGLIIAIRVSDHRQPDPTATIAIESQRTEREAIHAGKETRLAEISLMAERDRRADRTQQEILTAFLNRTDTGVYVFLGAVGTFCIIGTAAICLIAYHRSRNRNEVGLTRPGGYSGDCGLRRELTEILNKPDELQTLAGRTPVIYHPQKIKNGRVSA